MVEQVEAWVAGVTEQERLSPADSAPSAALAAAPSAVDRRIEDADLDLPDVLRQRRQSRKSVRRAETPLGAAPTLRELGTQRELGQQV